MTLDTEKAVATKRTESKNLSGVGKRQLKARFELESKAELVCGKYRVGTRSGLQAAGIVVFIPLLPLPRARVTDHHKDVNARHQRPTIELVIGVQWLKGGNSPIASPSWEIASY